MMKNRMLMALALVLSMLMMACAAFAEEEIPTWVEFDLDAGSEFGGILNVTYADGTSGETGAYSFGWENETAAPATVGDVLTAMEITSIEPVLEGDEFEGWMVYELAISVDEDGFETWSYVKAEDALYSTEELLALPAPDFYAVYTAKWASVAEEDYYAAIAEEESITMASITLLTGEGVMRMDYGEEEPSESTLLIVTVEDGQTFGEALMLENMLDVTMEGKEFTGWTVYDVYSMVSTDAPSEEEGTLCFELFDGWYMVLEEYNVCAGLVSTQELAGMVCDVTDHVVIANYQ